MWPRKKLFPWQASLGAGLKQTPGHTRVVGSVPLQNPRIYNNPEYGQPDQWVGGAGSVMDNILNELRNPGEVVLQPNQSPILTNPNDPYSVKQPDWNPSGGKYSYLENLNAKPSGSAGGGKWKKVMEHLGNMTGPEPDWSLSPQKMGVPSPWSPTNVAWSPVGGTMLDWKKKRTA